MLQSVGFVEIVGRRMSPGLTLEESDLLTVLLVLFGLGLTATWVLPPGWTQPISVTQFNAQYPWMTVDDRGQIRLRDDFRSWLEQRQAAGAQMTAPAAGGSAGGGAGAGAIPDGGAGYIPPSAMTFAPGTGTASGLGQNSFGNGVTAGNAAHI